MAPLNDKIVVVTGGSAGIGRATALSFARKGPKVLITGRGAASLDAAVEAHPNIAGFLADAGISEDAARTIAKALELWARLDILINNAGAGAILRLANIAPDRMSKIFAVNVFGPTLLAAAAPPT